MYQISSSPHTADVRYTIWADTLEEIFAAGLEIMGNLLKENFCRKNAENELRNNLREKRIVKTVSTDITALFVDFLSDVLIQSYEGKIVFCRLKIVSLGDNSIHAEIYGEKTDFFDEDIKAVTYHEARIHENELGKWQTNLIFDI